jgi:molybdate-binding protein
MQRLSASSDFDLPFVRRTHGVVLVKGYFRQQGIITRKGELISLDELAEAQFINRMPGQELAL